MSKNVSEMMEAAHAAVKFCKSSDAIEKLGKENVVFIDVRDKTEYECDGRIPNAQNFSRGMLEFLIDPKSPMHNPIFAEQKDFVFYCMSGGRSALAAHLAQEMGVSNVYLLKGGLKQWKAKGGPIE